MSIILPLLQGLEWVKMFFSDKRSSLLRAKNVLIHRGIGFSRSLRF
jgi:hypothetical protein